jgi:hypothetical protein
MEVMKSVQELIILGKIPEDTKSSENQPNYPNGWPIFTKIEDQVKYDWANLPSDRVRNLRSNLEYKTALEAFLLAPAVAVDAPGAAAPATLPVSIEEQIIAATPAPAAAVAPAIIAEPPAPVVPVEEEEGTKVGPYTKIKGGWEVRIESIDGSGEQVFQGKTKDEVSQKLVTAQANATAKIRQQQEENNQLLLEQPADIASPRKKLEPRALTADEKFQIAEDLSSGDPQRINKALDKRDLILFGAPAEEIVTRVVTSEAQLDRASYLATAKLFMKQHSDVEFSREFGDKLDAVLAESNWDYTVRNLNKALLILKEKGEVKMRVSTPVERRELPAPVVALPSAADPAAPVSAAVIPASAEAPVVAPASKVTPPAAAPVVEVGRLRPGSASTGLSPRQASVRPGARPEPSVGLTVEEYNRMSVSETRRRYKTDLGFKAAVDKLISEGKL